MYQVKVNSAYYESNFRKKDNKDGANKNRFSLNQTQSECIQSLLPKGYRLNIISEFDEKRSRTPKKIDAQFETMFLRGEPKREETVEKKLDKKEKEIKKGQKKEEDLINTLSAEKVQVLKKKKQKEEGKKKDDTIEEKVDLKKISSRIKSLSICPQVCQLHDPKKFFSAQLANLKNSRRLFKISNQYDLNLERTKIIQQQPPKQIYSQNISMQNQSQYKNHQGLTEGQKQFCLKFVTKLKNHKSSWPFRQPVDPISQKVPNYFLIVHEPMDLKTIDKKIINSKYEHISQFYEDINRIFLNSYKFNPRETNYYSLTMQLQSYFQQLKKQVITNPQILEPEKPSKGSRGKQATTKKQVDFNESVQDQTPIKKSKNNSAFKPLPQTQHNLLQQQKQKQEIKQGPAKILKTQPNKQKTKFSLKFRKQLLEKVAKLSSKALQKVVKLVFGDIDDSEDNFKIDFQNLKEETITKIQDILRAHESRVENSKINSIPHEKRISLF